SQAQPTNIFLGSPANGNGGARRDLLRGTDSSGAYTGACSAVRHLLRRRISQCQAFYTHRERHSDETYKSSFHARARFDSAVAKTASLDSKHRSNPASGANDSRQGPLEDQ